MYDCMYFSINGGYQGTGFMYICMYLRMCVCIIILNPINPYVYIYVCMYVCMYV